MSYVDIKLINCNQWINESICITDIYVFDIFQAYNVLDQIRKQMLR